jgi:AAA domain
MNANQPFSVPARRGVTPGQRFSRSSPCPVCGGDGSRRRGRGERCWGYVTEDGTHAFCTREEHARGLLQHPGTHAFLHRLDGSCDCGEDHGQCSGVPVPSSRIEKGSRPVETRYDYQNADGSVAYSVVRYGDKQFRIEHPETDEHGRTHFVKGLGKSRPILYRMNDLADERRALEPVFIPEGERDVDRLRAHYLLATTNLGGAGKWRPQFVPMLRGRNVVVLADNDDKGIEHANAVATSLVGVASSVKVLTFSELPPKADVSDFFDGGGTVCTMWLRIEALPEYESTPGTSGRQSLTAAELVKKVFEPPRHLVTDVVLAGCMILAARPKIGKSFMTLMLALAVANGAAAFGEFSTERSGVLVISLEDSERRVQRRLLSLSKDPDLVPSNDVFLEYEWKRMDDGGLADLEAWLDEHPHVGSVIVDSLQRIRNPQAGKAVYREDYDALASLQGLAQRRNIAVLVVHHTRKSEDRNNPADDISGSTGLQAAADGWIILKAAGEAGHVHMHVTHRDLEDSPVYELERVRGTGGWRYVGRVEAGPAGDRQRELKSKLGDKDIFVPDDVRQALGMGPNAVYQLLNRMVKGGEVVRVREGVYRWPH